MRDARYDNKFKKVVDILNQALYNSQCCSRVSLAQSVEHLTFNQRVTGSIPVRDTIDKK